MSILDFLCKNSHKLNNILQLVSYEYNESLLKEDETMSRREYEYVLRKIMEIAK